MVSQGQREQRQGGRLRQWRRDFLVDIGSSHVVLASRFHQQVLREPALVAHVMDSAPRGGGSRRIMAVGAAALEQPPTGRATWTVEPMVQRGAIVHDDALVVLLQQLRRRLRGPWVWRGLLPQVAAALLPPGMDEPARARLRGAMQELGWRRFLGISAPLAAVRGCGLDTAAPRGRLLVDLGGGRTSVSLLSMAQLVSHTILDVGGQDLDAAISRYAAERFGVVMDVHAARQVKHAIGTVFPPSAPMQLPYQGMDVRGHVEKRIVIDDNELRDVLVDALEPLIMGLQAVLGQLPPELAADVLEDGAVLVGGGAALGGLPAFLQERTSIRFSVAPDAINAAIHGAQALLREQLARRRWRRHLEA